MIEPTPSPDDRHVVLRVAFGAVLRYAALRVGDFRDATFFTLGFSVVVERGVRRCFAASTPAFPAQP